MKKPFVFGVAVGEENFLAGARKYQFFPTISSME